MLSLIQTVILFYRTLVHILYDYSETWSSLDDLVKLVAAASEEAALSAVSAITDELNECVRQNRICLRNGWRMKETVVRTVKCSLGILHLHKDVYQHRETRRCSAPVFEALGITPHQKSTKELMHRVLDLSAVMSFQKAIDALDAGICRQTAINWLRYRMPDLEKAGSAILRRVETLHVFLDEDHVSMMKDPKRSHMIVPVGAVAEGRSEECDGRFRLISPFYCLSTDMSPGNLTDSITGYICSHYDLNALKTICVHGDGAQWIQKSFEGFCQVKHIFDGFHFEREIRRCCRRFGEENKKAQKLLRKAIENDDKGMAEALLNSLGTMNADTHIHEKTEEFLKYLLKNWDAIRERIASNPLGSCTEAMVQHIASERFSSTPHGWSRQTLTKLCRLRALHVNGGSLSDPQCVVQPAGTYAQYEARYIADLLEKPMDFSIFEHTLFAFNGDSGTQHLLDKLEQGGQLILGQ